jgi:predicted RND superfamily exporter protein
MKKLSDFIIEKRIWILIITFLFTLFFIYKMKDLKVYTRFADLLPQRHEYIKLHNRIRAQFGGANTVTMVLQVREGDIFNPTTLQKIRDITDELYYIPGVDRFKILSISVNMMVDMVVTSGAFDFQPLMWPDVPKTQEEVEELREKIYASMFYGSFVWFDSKKTLIRADFFEDEIDYSVVYRELLRIQEKYEDDNHILSIAGEPLHLGYVDSYVGAVMRIMAITLVVMLFLFLFYFGSLRGMFIPVFAALVSGVWGMGFMVLLGYNLDPLVMVFPFLVAAMAACHSVQVIKRYVEECAECEDNKTACKRVIEHLFKPGFTGIVTDATGIILIALTPIQILQKITITCTFWSIATVIIAMLFVPCVLSYLPFPHRSVARLKKRSLLDRGLATFGAWIPRGGCWVILLIFAVLLTGGTYLARDIQVGDAVPGSSLLWPFHRFNQDGFRIAFSMPILSPLYVVMEGEEQWDLVSCPGKKRQLCGENFTEMYRFEKFMRETPGRLVMFTQSVITQFPGSNWLIHEGDPNWYFFPTEDRGILYSYRRVTQTGIPGSTDMYVDADSDISANIIIYCRDKMTPTIKAVMARVKEYIEEHSRLELPMSYKLAGGDFGVQAAINEVIEKYQIRTLGWSLLAIFLFCTIIFRSLLAGVILVIPLIVSNIIAFALMATGFLYAIPTPITITTSTLPVSAVGIGLGVDYGVYLLSRIMEEYKSSQDLNAAITTAMRTTGKAVIYVSTTLTIGILFWVISPLMFQAMMGFFLAVILFLNMVGALLLVTSFVAVLKPRFIVG